MRSCQVEVIAERGSHLYLNYNSNTSLARKLSHSINFLHRRMLTFYCNISDNASIWRLYPGWPLSVQQSALVSWLAPSVGLMVTVFCRGQQRMKSYSVFWLVAWVWKKSRSDLQLQASIKDYQASPIDIVTCKYRYLCIVRTDAAIPAWLSSAVSSVTSWPPSIPGWSLTGQSRISTIYSPQRAASRLDKNYLGTRADPELPTPAHYWPDPTEAEQVQVDNV